MGHVIADKETRQQEVRRSVASSKRGNRHSTAMGERGGGALKPTSPPSSRHGLGFRSSSSFLPSSANPSPSPPPRIHTKYFLDSLFVSIINNSASNCKYAAEQFESRFGNELLVHCSARNASTLTFDGVDVMGHRLAEEVKDIVGKSPSLKRISFVAHSLGGLIARYAIGQLFCPPSNDVKKSDPETPQGLPLCGTIVGLQPINFVTVATPHIGSRGNWQLPFLCGITFLEKIAFSSAHWFVGRTGKHLFLTDGNGTQIPLLQRMVTDCAEGQFISALQAFELRVAYANVNYDHMVGWRTATFRRECEIPQLSMKAIDAKYPHVIHVEEVSPEQIDVSTRAKDPIEEEMISGLRRLSWRRVDVSFSGTPQKLIAHNTIQIKDYWMHFDGADVIAHIIDNFVL